MLLNVIYIISKNATHMQKMYVLGQIRTVYDP